MNSGNKDLRIITRYLAALLLLIAYNKSCIAQSSVGVPPLVIEHPRPSFGFEAGVGQNSQSGTMECECGSTFTGGKGNGWSASGFFELPVGNDFNVGLKAGYDRENTSTTTPANEVVIIMIPNSNNSETTTLPVNQNATLNIAFFHFDPFIQYQVLHSDFFVQLGAGISILSSSQFSQTRTMTSNSANMGGTTNNSVTFANGSTTEAIEGGSIGGITSPQFSGIISAGYNFRFGMTSIAPMLNYDYPFSINSSPTTSFPGGNNWKISTISGSIAMKFNL
jgi:hypothetical protein